MTQIAADRLSSSAAALPGYGRRGYWLTISAVTALALDKHLGRANGKVSQVAQKFQQDLAKVIKPVWLMSTGADYYWLESARETRSWLTRFSHWYTDKLIAAIPHSQYIQLEFSDVSHLMKPATALFAPGVVLRLLGHHLRQPVDGR